jgi:hypothetical protein
MADDTKMIEKSSSSMNYCFDLLSQRMHQKRVQQERLEMTHLHQSQKLIAGEYLLIKLKVANRRNCSSIIHLLLHIHQLIENAVVVRIIIEGKGEALPKNIAIIDTDIEARIISILLEL